MGQVVEGKTYVVAGLPFVDIPVIKGALKSKPGGSAKPARR